MGLFRTTEYKDWTYSLIVRRVTCVLVVEPLCSLVPQVKVKELVLSVFGPQSRIRSFTVSSTTNTKI